MMPLLPNNAFSLLSIHDAARRLGVSTKTLRRWEEAGKIIPSRTFGNQRRYTLAQIEELKNPTKTKEYKIYKNYTFPTKLFLVALGVLIVAIGVFTEILRGKSASPVGRNTPQNPSLTQAAPVSGTVLGQSLVIPAVLAAASPSGDFIFSVNVPAVFNESATFQKGIAVTGDVVDPTGTGIFNKVTASNILYGVVAGSGISVSSGQTPTIANTGVLSLGGKTGTVTLTAGSGITVDGTTIANSDTGTAQNIFKTISVAGQDDIAASSNTDILTFAQSGGITLTTDATTKTVTIDSATPNYALSGWTKTGTVIGLTTTTDTVNIGSSALTAGATTLSSLDVSSGGITHAGSIVGATGLTSSGQITFSAFNSAGILHNNVNGVLSSSAVNLTNGDISGTLPTSHGGTGLIGFITGDIPYASASGLFHTLGIGSPGNVLIVSGGIPAWGTITGGSGGVCTDCLVTDPGSNQIITPTSAITGLIIRKAGSGTADIFKVTDNTGGTNFLTVDSSGNIIFGSGTVSSLNTGIFTVNPAGSDPITISPVATSSATFTGTITSQYLGQARTWTFPDQSGIICTTAGNCTGTSSSLGGNGTANYLSKWQSTYALTNSLLYDIGTYVGIGTTNPTHTLDVSGTASVSGAVNLGSTLGVAGSTTLSSSLDVAGTANFQSTLGVSGATTLSSTVGITGNTTIGGNLMVNGAGNSYFSAGNLGIGTTAPLSILDVAGTTDVDAITLSGGGAKKLGINWTTNAVNLDVFSAEPTDKLTNSTFETDLSGWTGSGPSTTAVPTDYSGLTLWLDGSDATTLYKDAGVTPVSADGDVVGRWADKSGSSRHVNQTGASSIKPLYKTNIQNSKSAVLFDGTDDYMSGLALSNFITNSAFTYVAVVKPIVLDTNASAPWDNDTFITDSGGYFGMHAKSAPTFHAFNYDIAPEITTHSVTIATPYVFSAWHSGGKLYSSLNSGVSQSLTSGNTGGTLTGTLKLGDNYNNSVYTNTYIMEIAVYNTVLSDANRQALEASMNAKWTVTGTTTNTATRDTSIKYAGAASTKLIANISDYKYLQSANVGNTSTYTLTAYAYTNGSAVTTTDLDLYYDGAELPTTFDATTQAGWYRLTGTITGVASAKDYGVRVHIGKTVYVDNITLTVGTAPNTTLYVAHSGSGLAQLDVESTTTLHTGQATSKALIIKGFTSQTSNLTEWQNVDGTVLSVVDASGNLGIGTSAPTLKFQTYNSSSTGKVAGLYRGLQGNDSSMVTTFGTPYLAIGGGEAKAGSIQTIGFGYSGGATGANPLTSYQPAEIGFLTDTPLTAYTSGSIVFANRSNGNNNVAPTEVMRITSTGNVGIGTTAPGSKLDITGTGTFAAAGVSALNLGAHTVTLSGANPTTYATFYGAKIGAMTLAGTNAGQTVTDASTLYVDTPVQGTNVTIGTIKPINTATGAYLSSTGVWTDNSSQTLKENFEAVDYTNILQKISGLSIDRWNYIANADTITHIGPTAENFYDTFGVGEDNAHLAALDTAGIALAGVKGLIERANTVLDLTVVKQLEADGAVTFKAQVEFQGPALFRAIAEYFDTVIFHNRVIFGDRDMAGQAIISKYTNSVDIVFAKPYEKMPVVTFSFVEPESTQSATFIEEGQRAYLKGVTEKGFSIVLPDLAIHDYFYNWTAIAVSDMTTTKSKSLIEDVAGESTSSAEASSSATPTPVLDAVTPEASSSGTP